MNRLKHVIIACYRNMLSLYHAMNWTIDALILKKSIRYQKSLEIDLSAKVLILAPHSDDEWIGCSRIIVNMPNSIIINMNMEGGDDPQKHLLRNNEMMRLANDFNRKIVNIGTDKIGSLIQIIQEESPSYICVPYFFDWHVEHIKVLRILNDSIQCSNYYGKIISYHISVPLPLEASNCVMPLSKIDQAKKWELFLQYYPSQSFMPILRFKNHEKISGALIGSYAAEVYNCIPVQDWQRNIAKYSLSQKESEMLKQNLCSIRKIHNLINRMHLDKTKNYVSNETY